MKKQNRITFLSWTLFLMSISYGHAFAGSATSGGGASAVCRDANHNVSSAQMEDLYEGGITYGYQIPHFATAATIQLQAAISRISNQFFKDTLTEVASLSILANFHFLPPGVGLNVPPDLGNEVGVVVPDGCGLEAVGYYQTNGVLKVSQSVYEAFSPTDRAAFILHESIAKMARETSKITTTTLARQLTAALFASNSSQQEIDNLASQLIYANVFEGRVDATFTLSQNLNQLNLAVTPLTTSSPSYRSIINCMGYDASPEINPVSQVIVNGPGPATSPLTLSSTCHGLLVYTYGDPIQSAVVPIEFDINSSSGSIGSVQTTYPGVYSIYIPFARATQLSPIP